MTASRRYTDPDWLDRPYTSLRERIEGLERIVGEAVEDMYERDSMGHTDLSQARFWLCYIDRQLGYILEDMGDD